VKILHLTDRYLPATQNWLYPQIVSVPGATTAVLCGDRSEAGGFPLHGRPLYCEHPQIATSAYLGRIGRGVLSRFCQVIARGRAWAWGPEILHAHFGTRGWQALPLKRMLGAPLVTTFYGVEAWAYPNIFPVWRERYAQLFEEGDLFLVEGPAMRDRMVAIGCPAKKIVIRHLGVDLTVTPFSTPDPGAGIRIVMVGRFVAKTGLADGLRACVAAARAGANLSVTIVGDALNGENLADARIKRELLELAKAPELDGRVNFTGFLAPPGMRATLSQSDVILCPSKHSDDGDAEGGMPFVLAEAMAMGLVAVGSRHCDMPELIADATMGFLFDEGDIDALTAILWKCAHSPSEFFQQMAISGRRHVEKHFDLARQLAELASIYRACVDPGLRESLCTSDSKHVLGSSRRLQ
jgi:glycosyltransferase involved in cell wall biosynthesis